ncbi:hypothetical protein C0J52_04406 [Blattella germanica]|nr:hypothetical protein C0J52_04406 [Blattella germanica]
MEEGNKGLVPTGDEIVISGISGCFPAADNIDEFQKKLFNKEDLVRPKEESHWKNGVNPSELHGTNTAVFTGSNISESENTYIYIPVKNNLAVMGHSRAMVSNRISYWLDVHGTSISMVSMETTGFEALSAACNEMRKGRCDAAVVGAVNLVMHPEMSYHYNELGVLSKDGKTKAFDEGGKCLWVPIHKSSDGYARSEGVVAMFLQRARDARRIYATVVNAEFDAFGNRDIGYTTPYGAPLANLMKHFYDSCGIDPNDIDYLEAEGLGTKFGDEEEMRAVDEVLLHNRKAPLLIGSVKSNMGHGNAAANFCSVAKVLIAMQSGAIPPNLHFTTPSHRIEALIQRRAQVVTETTPWKGGLVALNSMGMTGTYAHVLLQSLGNDKENNVHNDSLPRLIVTSSRTEDGVTTILNKAYVYQFSSGNCLNHYDLSSRPVWFIFSGMGSQWATMGKELMKLPVCAKAIDKCHNILLEKNLDLKHIITTHDGKVFDNILHSFIGIAAIQIALVDMLKAIGITPDGMVGHSVGELGCAYADECLTLKQMILSAYYRGLASLQAELIPGSMAAVGLGHARINKLVPPEIDIACHNSFDSCTLSGPVDFVNDFVEYLKSRNIFAKAVNVSNIAYHSRYIKPAAPLLLESLKQLLPDPKPRSNRWVSSSIPEEDWNTPLAQTCSPEYLTNNLLSSVLFEEASKHIPKNAITIEIAPHGLLQAILRRSLPPECTNIALTQRGHKQGLYFLLSAIGKLYLMGLSPQLKELYPPVQLPVSRGTPSISPLVRWDHCDSWYTVGEVDNSALISGEREVLVNLNKEEFRTYADHIVDGQIFFPAFGYLKLVWDTLAILKETTLNKLPIVFENVKFLRHTHIAERGSQMLTINVQRGSGKFEISSDNELVVTGTVLIPQNVADCYSQLPTVPSGGIELPGEDIYAELEQRGYGYNGNFKGIKKVRINKLVAAYNYATDIIHCGGMEIQRLKTVTFTRQQLTINFEALQFVEFSNPKLQSMEQFISMSVQMTLENSSSKKIVSVLVLSATDIRSKIKFLTHKYPQIALDMEIHPEKIYNLIVVTRQKDLPMAVPLICANGGFLLARMEGIKWHVNSDLVPVVRQMFENKEYVLYRKSSTWLQQIRNAGPCHHLLAVVQLNDQGVEILPVVEQITKLDFHYVSVYNKIKQLDLMVNVIYNGEWGSFCFLPLENSNKFYENSLPSVHRMQGIDISFLGINSSLLSKYVEESSVKTEKEFDSLDFSGYSKSGQKVMGMAAWHHEDKRLYSDKQLTWTVPESWNLQDAATVPVAYTMAYYPLEMLAKCRNGGTVLVIGGCTYIGQAAISLAADLGYVIFTTVANNEQKMFIKQNFPKNVESLADTSINSKVLLSMSETDNDSMPQTSLVHDQKSFYLVVGSEVKQCLDVVEWLVQQGVHQVAVTTKNDGVSKLAEHRIKLMHSYRNAKVIFFKARTLTCTDSVLQLLQEASSVFTGPLEGIFVLPLDLNGQENGKSILAVTSLDRAIRGCKTVKHFVCLLMRNSWNICERRHREGLPALSVFWNQHGHKHFNFRRSLRILNRLITSKIHTPVLIVTETSKKIEERNRELPSLSPGYGEVKEIPPIFIIPGLQGPPAEILKPLTRNLMYPVFCSRLVEIGTSINDAASVLVKFTDIIKIENWDQLVSNALERLPEIIKSPVSVALSYIRSCVKMVLEYKPSIELLKGEICLIRPSEGSEDDNCGLVQFFKHTVNIHIVEGDHMTMLSCCKTANIVNDFIL